MILAPRLQFYCGSYEIPNETLEKCAMVISQAEPVQRYLHTHGKNFGASRQDDDSTQFGQQIVTIYGVRTKYVDEPIENLFFLGRCSNATNAHDHAYAMLGLIKERLNRDKGEPGYKLPVPDYSKLVKHTYLEFSKTFLDATGDLRLLSHVEDSSRRSINSLPSWIPDLSVRLWPQPLRSASNTSVTWCAPGSLPFKGSSVDGCILTIHAASIDIIKEAAMPFGNTTVWIDVFRLINRLRRAGCCNKDIDRALVRTLVTDSYPAMEFMDEHKALHKDFKDWLIDELAQLGEDTGYLGINDHATEFLRDHMTRQNARAADYLQDTRDDNVAAVRAYIQHLPSKMITPQEWVASSERYDTVQVEAEYVYAELRYILGQTKAVSEVLPTGKEIDNGLRVRKGPDSAKKASMIEAADRSRSQICLKTKTRRIMRTAKGRLGMGPSSLRAGDRVFVVPGVNTPLTMRRLDPGHYQVVGEAYVHGIMHGEAVTRDVQTMEVNLGNDVDNRVYALLLPRQEDTTEGARSTTSKE